MTDIREEYFEYIINYKNINCVNILVNCSNCVIIYLSISREHSYVMCIKEVSGKALVLGENTNSFSFLNLNI